MFDIVEKICTGFIYVCVCILAFILVYTVVTGIIADRNPEFPKVVDRCDTTELVDQIIMCGAEGREAVIYPEADDLNKFYVRCKEGG